MTEPVAYWCIPQIDGEEICVSFDPSKSLNFENIPLYTSEQLQPRVKMTQVEFDEFKKLKSLNPTEDLIAILKIVSRFKYTNLQSRLVCSIENQTEFATLWLRGMHERLEELIDIVPDMKWFVRSKEKYEADIVQGLPESGYLYLTDGGSYSIEYCEMTTFKDDATQFGTKEEAELWTDQLTEAVRLAVEEK